MRHPPAAATWLLTHLAPSTPESMFGDLQEEYEADRSTSWYWRQVFRAIVSAITRQVTAHPLLTLRAVCVGWILLWILFNYVFPSLFFGSPAEWLFVRGVVDIRLWWPKTPRGLLAYIIAPPALAGAGWIIGRFHKREMLLIFVVTLQAWNLMATTYAFRQGWFREGLLISVVSYFVVVPVSILVGGLTARPEAIE